MIQRNLSGRLCKMQKKACCSLARELWERPPHTRVGASWKAANFGDHSSFFLKKDGLPKTAMVTTAFQLLGEKKQMP